MIETATRRNAKVTGYHFDASEVAPQAWLTGASWEWGPLYVEMVRTLRGGKFEGSKFDGRYRCGLRERCVQLAPLGSAATPAICEKVSAALEEIKAGERKPFAEEIKDQRGRVRIRGSQPAVETLEATDYLIGPRSMASIPQPCEGTEPRR